MKKHAITHWKTTLAGLITAVAGAVYTYMEASGGDVDWTKLSGAALFGLVGFIIKDPGGGK